MSKCGFAFGCRYCQLALSFREGATPTLRPQWARLDQKPTYHAVKHLVDTDDAGQRSRWCQTVRPTSQLPIAVFVVTRAKDHKVSSVAQLVNIVCHRNDQPQCPHGQPTDLPLLSLIHRFPGRKSLYEESSAFSTRPSATGSVSMALRVTSSATSYHVGLR